MARRTGSGRVEALGVLVAVAVAGAAFVAMGGPASEAGAAPGGGFVAVEVGRLLDTRAGASTLDGDGAGGGPVAAGTHIAFDVVGRAGIGADVVAVAATITITEPVGPGFATLFPCGDLPPTSNVNFVGGQTVAASAITGLSADGRLCVHASASAHVVVDVTGAFTGGFVPIVPVRALDTRPGSLTSDGQEAGRGRIGPDEVVTVPIGGRLGVPPDAIAIAITVTVTEGSRAGFVTVYPAGPRPLASTVNVAAHETRANATLVSIEAGLLSVYAQSSVHVIVDVSGYVPAGSDHGSLRPARIADTRFGEASVDGACTGVGRVAGGTSMTLQIAGRGGVPATGVGAVALGVVATGSKRPGFVTAYRGVGPVPTASMVNVGAADTVASSVILPVDDQGRVALFANVGLHVVVDVVGWFPGTAVAAPDEGCAGTFVDPRQRHQLAASADRHGCALLDERRIQCWTMTMLGIRMHEQPTEPFTGDLVELAISQATLCALRTDATVACRRRFTSDVFEQVFPRPIVDIVGFGMSDGMCAIDDLGGVRCWSPANATVGDVAPAVPSSGPAIGFTSSSVDVAQVAVQTSVGTADLVVRRADGSYGVASTSTVAAAGHPWSTVASARVFYDGQLCLVLLDGRATCGTSGDLAPELDVSWNGDGVIHDPFGTVVPVWHDEDTGLFSADPTVPGGLIFPSRLEDCSGIGVIAPDLWCWPARPSS